MKTLEKIVTSLEASRKIKEYLGDDAPESLFYHCSCGNITTSSSGSSTHSKNHTQEGWQTSDIIKYPPAYTFSELIIEVLPKVAEKLKWTKKTHIDYTNFLVDVEDLMNEGMEAVSEKIISIID